MQMLPSTLEPLGCLRASCAAGAHLAPPACGFPSVTSPGLQGNNTVPTGHGQSQGTIINGNRNPLIIPDLSTVTVLAS